MAADQRALVHVSGLTKRIIDEDTLIVGAGVTTASGDLMLGAGSRRIRVSGVFLGNLGTGGVSTGSVTSGRAVYITSANSVLHTDALAMATARFVGFFEGEDGSLTSNGVVEAAAFTTDGGEPVNGAPVFLAEATDDGGTAEGKLTAQAPSAPGSVYAEVGICLDNGNYAGAKTCRVLIQTKQALQL